jgi:hypothetical protein
MNLSKVDGLVNIDVLIHHRTFPVILQTSSPPAIHVSGVPAVLGLYMRLKIGVAIVKLSTIVLYEGFGAEQYDKAVVRRGRDRASDTAGVRK